MVMVDEVLVSEGPVTETSLLIREDNVFVENGVFTEPGLIENMAQTAAAGSGAKPGAADQEPHTGFIGSIRNLEIRHLPSAGETIRTRVTVEHTILNASVIKAEVYRGSTVLAACEMKIFQV